MIFNVLDLKDKDRRPEKGNRASFLLFIFDRYYACVLKYFHKKIMFEKIMLTRSVSYSMMNAS